MNDKCDSDARAAYKTPYGFLMLYSKLLESIPSLDHVHPHGSLYPS